MHQVTLNGNWKRTHFNWPQRRSMIVRANIEVAKFSRGVGKSKGVVGPRLSHNAFAMPRSVGALLGPTYKKLKKDILGSILDGLSSLGYVEEQHYVIGKRGPRNWPQPYNRVKEWGDLIHWCTGSVRVLLSQDQPGMGNGLNLDDIIVEEAKLIDSERFYQDTFPAMRGNLQHFGHLSEHHGLLIVSDAGATPEARWFEKFKDRMDKEVITMILQAAYRQQQHIIALNKGGLTSGTQRMYMGQINQLEKDLVYLRKNAVHYHEANALDNIDVIGWDRFLNAEASMPDRDFRRSYLNESVDQVDGAWYHGLDETIHCYVPKTTAHTIARGHDKESRNTFDCRDDAEILTNAPIDIALDYGGKFNCMAVGQSFFDTYRIDNGFHGTHPEVLGDVLDKFINHYRYHHHKTVNYFFDNTAKDKHGTTRFTYYDIVMSKLSDNGWDVNPVYIGKTPPPEHRYEMMVHLLRRTDRPVQWNPDNCSDMLASMKLTQIREGSLGIKKDKRPEGRSDAEQVHAPHYGDAVDTLLWARFNMSERPGPLPAFSLLS